MKSRRGASTSAPAQADGAASAKSKPRHSKTHVRHIELIEASLPARCWSGVLEARGTREVSKVRIRRAGRAASRWRIAVGRTGLGSLFVGGLMGEREAVDWNNRTYQLYIL